MRYFCYVNRIVENTLYVTTPAVNETCHLAIELEMNDGSWINTSRTFEYRSNPVFTDIQPRNHLVVWVDSSF